MRLPIVLTFVIALTVSSSRDASANPENFPDAPLVTRDLAHMKGLPGNMEYTIPHVSPLRVSNDGRVGLSTSAGTFRFNLNRPEQISGKVLDLPPGQALLGGPVNLSALTFDKPGHPATLKADLDDEYSPSQMLLCDGTTENTEPGRIQRENPYTCPGDPKADCYDLTVIQSSRKICDHAPVPPGCRPGTLLRSVEVTVKVSEPKTPRARIASVVARRDSFLSRELPYRRFLEGVTTADGRLLIVRLSQSSVGGRWGTKPYDVVYSHYGEHENAPDGSRVATRPCDLGRWLRNGFNPITHAPHDESIRYKYGFARHKFRDGEGNEIPDGVDLMGTYPWIDRLGRNLFFLSVSSTLFYQDDSALITSARSRYPTRCVAGIDSCAPPAVTSASEIHAKFDEGSSTRGVTMLGLWSHGKMVLLDGSLNHIDYGLGNDDRRQQVVHLYKPRAGLPGSALARLGAGRNLSPAAMPANGGTTNNNIIDSLENLFFYNRNMRPITQRDVVWAMSTGVSHDEVAFDDYVDPHAFVVSEMSGSLTHPLAKGGAPKDTTTTVNGRTFVLRQDRLDYHDGFFSTGITRGVGFRREVRVQNAANGAIWNVPKAGRVIGRGRLEPVAQGGIHGRGMWLFPDTAVVYDVPEQPVDPALQPWYIGMFLDPRFGDDGVSRRLLTFPDGSSISMEGRSKIAIHSGQGALVKRLPIPSHIERDRASWFHLGFIASQGAATVTAVFNGNVSVSFAKPPSARLFGIRRGTLTLGEHRESGGGGFRGWVDDLKIIGYDPTYEVVCNHARGTIVGVDKGASGLPAPLRKVLDDPAYPVAVSNHIRSLLPASKRFSRYVCFTDWERSPTGFSIDFPSGVVPVRHELNTQGKELIAGKPRPDFSSNHFCQSCHIDLADRKFTLKTGVLRSYQNLMLEFDTRRQPMQALRRLYGNIPAGMFHPENGPAAPGTDISSDFPKLTDRYIYRWNP